MIEVFLGIDVGTTGIKALAADGGGEVVWSASRPLALLTPRPAWAEQNPETWWEGVASILREIPRDLKVARIGLSGQMHTLVPLDASGRVIRDAILWCDQRTAAECEYATRELGGEERVIGYTGNPIYPGFTLPKILWIRNNEPENYKRLSMCLIAKDFIAWRLTGEFGTEPSDASGSAMFDVTKREWNAPLLSALGIGQKLLPPVRGSYQVRGKLKDDLVFSESLAGAEVVSGGADNAAAALGLGVCEPGDCMISIGTSGTALAVTENDTPDKTGRLHFFNHVIPGVSYYMGVMLAAAASQNWFKDRMAPDRSWAEVEAGIERAPIGADGLLWLPYLQGERTPHRNPNARGVLFGLSTMTDEARVFRAVMEGITFGLRDSFELLKKITPIKRVLVVGGGAKSAVWRKMLAANTKTPINVPVVDEGGAYGAAMLAALGGGMKLSEVKNWVKAGGVTQPDESEYARYDAVYEQFRALYSDLTGRFDAVAAL
jgi:xylulokinase